MKSLDELFLFFGADKASNCHDYSKYYEMFFRPIKDEKVKLLEIGIFGGASLRAWREYFPNGEISGIDLRGNYEYLIEEGCKATYIVDQSSREQVEKFNDEHNQEYSIIIDDGSHEATDQIQTFEILFKGLQPGGYYVIEDLLTSNDKSRWGRNANTYDRIRQMVGEVSMNAKGSNDCLCSNKVGEVHKYLQSLNYFEANIEWFFLSCGLLIIKKMP
jgi:hypothetical protein